MSEESVKNGLNHILLIYRRYVVEFLGRDQFINTLLDIINYLYTTSIRVVSVYESSGLVYRIIKENFKQRLLRCGFIIHSISDNSLTLSKLGVDNSTSEFNVNSGSFTFRLNYFNASSAHLELLSLCDSFKKQKKVKKKIKKKRKKKGGKTHKIPADSAILQPIIANKLSVSTPEMIICIHLSLGQILFTFNIPFSQRLCNLKSLIANATAPAKRYIYPFGPSGIPPWTLSEAEIYQVFGTSPNLIEECINLFINSNRRHGR